ncbi:hypothetical protein TNCV_2206331 [Trichonephila clavipes]|uniref:Uncharacterized protein n=1 Tax=Trichonephila clavipes TaxID=2585209 RepID=A0A8X6S9B4_TRICX|nr:hypothetical protein TNCV_2206331 [Trichonephila clavipes]
MPSRGAVNLYSILNATGVHLVVLFFPLQFRNKPFSLALSSSPFQPGLSSHAFSIQGRAFPHPGPGSSSFFPHPLKKTPFKHQGWIHNTPLVPSYWQITNVSLGLSRPICALHTNTHPGRLAQGAIIPCPTSGHTCPSRHLFLLSPSLNTRKDDMILLRQASPIVNGAPALLYHYGDPSECRHSPSSDIKQ